MPDVLFGRDSSQNPCILGNSTDASAILQECDTGNRTCCSCCAGTTAHFFPHVHRIMRGQGSAANGSPTELRIERHFRHLPRSWVTFWMTMHLCAHRPRPARACVS